MADAKPVLLMTRPKTVAERFLTDLRLRDTGFVPIVSPLFDIVFTDAPIDTDGVRGVIFTSANGVAAWGARGQTLDLPCYVVGARTAQAARDMGMVPRIVAPDADALVAAIIAADIDGPLLHLTGRHTRGDVAARLINGGLPTTAIMVYDQPQRPLTDAARAALNGTVPVVAPVFSPRTGKLLSAQAVKAPLLVAAMSEAVVFTLAPLHIESLKVASRPDSEGMLDTVAALLVEARQRMQ